MELIRNYKNKLLYKINGKITFTQQTKKRSVIIYTEIARNPIGTFFFIQDSNCEDIISWS
jgi:hypothetical protein